MSAAATPGDPTLCAKRNRRAKSEDDALSLILDTPKGKQHGHDLCLNYTKTNKLTGRGVFAKRDIQLGEILDVSPVLVLPIDENRQYIEKTVLYHYT